MSRRLSLVWLQPLLFKPQIVLSNGHFFSAAVCAKYVSQRQPEKIGVGRQPNVSHSRAICIGREYPELCSRLSKPFNMHDGIQHYIQGKRTHYIQTNFCSLHFKTDDAAQEPYLFLANSPGLSGAWIYSPSMNTRVGTSPSFCILRVSGGATGNISTNQPIFV